MIRKVCFSLIMCAISLLAMAQHQVVTHVVQRGETIESIAKQYNVTVADINKANPNAEGVVYVGMKLNVPTNSNTTIKKDIAVSKHLQLVKKRLRLPRKTQRISTMRIKHPLI